jgi:hypothetical protein
VIENQHAEPTPAALADIRAMLAEGLDDDAPIPRRKAILNRLIAEIRIESPEAIYPTFKLPMDSLSDQTVRPLFGVVDPGSHNTNPAASLRAGPINLVLPGCRTGERRHADRKPRGAAIGQGF